MPSYGEWLPCSHPELCGVPRAVVVCRSSRAGCPYPFSLRAPRACYPFLDLHWHDPISARYVFWCPAPWTCAAAAGPVVFALSACVLSRLCAGCQTGCAAMMSGRSRRYGRHPRARIFISSQTQIPVSGVLQCWTSDLHVLVPMFRVQGRAMQSGASKTQVAHSNFCFAE